MTEDVTGTPVSIGDVRDAIEAVTALLGNVRLLVSLPPRLAVNVTNIRRCLLELEAIKATASTGVTG